VSSSELWSWYAPQYWHCMDDSYGVKEKDGRGECKGCARACASGVKGTGPVLDAEWLFVRLNSLWRKKILARTEAFIGETMTGERAQSVLGETDIFEPVNPLIDCSTYKEKVQTQLLEDGHSLTDHLIRTPRYFFSHSCSFLHRSSPFCPKHPLTPSSSFQCCCPEYQRHRQPRTEQRYPW
jgi:hypothetical protein